MVRKTKQAYKLVLQVKVKIIMIAFDKKFTIFSIGIMLSDKGWLPLKKLFCTLKKVFGEL